MIENIAECPLLFIQDNKHIHHDIMTNANHKTSFDSQNNDEMDSDAPLNDQPLARLISQPRDPEQ